MSNTMNLWPETKQAVMLISRGEVNPRQAAQVVGRIAQGTPANAIRRHGLKNEWHQKARQMGISLAAYFKIWMQVRVRLGEATGF